MAQQLTPTALASKPRTASAAARQQHRSFLPTERWLSRANDTAPADPAIATAVPATGRVRWSEAAERLANGTFLEFWPSLVAEPEDANDLTLVTWARAQANRRLQTAIDQHELELITVPVPLAKTVLGRLGQHVAAGLQAIGL